MQAVQDVAQRNVTADLPRVTAPPHHGGRRRRSHPRRPGARGRYIYDHLVNARFREIADSGHANLLDNLEVSNRHVVDFLARVDVGEGRLWRRPHDPSVTPAFDSAAQPA